MTSLYRGHIQNVSTQRHTCTCRILLQYGMLESERYQIHHLSAVIIHVMKQLNSQVLAVPTSHSTTHRHKGKNPSCTELHTASEIKLLAFHLLFLTLEDYPSVLLYMQQLMLSHCVILSTFSHSALPCQHCLSHIPTLNKHQIRPR